MSYKKSILFLSIILFSQFLVAENIDKKTSDQFNLIFKNLSTILATPPKDDHLVAEHCNFIIEKIQSGEISIVFDSTLNQNFIGCASANYSKSHKNIELSFGQYLVDAYPKYPLLVNCILVHEMQHLYDYFTNKQLFLIGLDNNIEKLYFEADALSLEALYVNLYLKDKFELGPFENYLLQDLNNGMTGSVLLYYKTDLTLLHKLDDIRSHNKSINKAINEFITIGQKLLDDKFDNNPWNNYCKFIALRTYVFYSKQVLYDINCKIGDKTCNPNIFESKIFPQAVEMVNKIKQYANENDSKVDFQKSYIDKLEKYYKISN